MDGILAKKKESFSHITLIGIEAALQAGDVLRQGFGTSFKISSKAGQHNLVTEYDHRAEKLILDFLSAQVPGSRFYAEESGKSGPRGSTRWIVDPLDGTVNFAHGIPAFCVSIAAEIKGEVVSGIVYQPITHELFVAEKGKGAFLNGQKIKVSRTPSLEQSILATGFPYNLAKNPHHCIDHFVDILRMGIPIRRMGSAAIDLAYTAAGRFDGFFEVELQPWDVAAGILLVEEAGGKATRWDKKPVSLEAKTHILATNGHIHAEGVKVLNKSIPT